MESFLNDIEIIEFRRPDSTKKCIFVSNIPKVKDEEDFHFKTQKKLEQKFGEFGLVYEVTVIDSLSGDMFGFVKFYSERDATQAKRQLAGRLFINGKLARLKYTTRQLPSESPVLYLAKCVELANYFLGFNGWSIQVLRLSEELLFEGSGTDKVCYSCVVGLHLTKHGLNTVAMATNSQTYQQQALSSKSVAICKAKKRAYQEAVQNAFVKVILVRLHDNRIHVEINTTVEESIHFDEDINTTELLKVTELEHDPDRESEESDSVTEVDDINKLILQDLAEDNF